MRLAAALGALLVVWGGRDARSDAGVCTYYIEHVVAEGAGADAALISAVDRALAAREKENNEAPFVSYPNSWCEGDRFPRYDKASRLHGRWGEPGSAMLYKVRWLKRSRSGAASVQLEIYVFDRPRFRRVANSGPVLLDDDPKKPLPEQIAAAIAVFSHGK